MLIHVIRGYKNRFCVSPDYQNTHSKNTFFKANLMLAQNIYLSWRKKPNETRLIVGKINRNEIGNGIVFAYTEELEQAQKEGFSYVMGLKEVKRLSPIEIENQLSYRIVSKSKANRNEILRFWEAENREDIFDLLALTQGRSPTDSFEFLADFSESTEKHFKFVTDVASLSHLNIPSNFVKEGDILSYKHEKDNQTDKNAIALYKDESKVGYIKRIHNRLFVSKKDLNLTVKSITANGVIKAMYVTVES